MNPHVRLKAFSFTYFMTLALLVSYFPLYFDAKGYSTVQIGILYAAGPLVGIASNLVWGVVSDKLQTVKKLFVLLFIGQLAAILAIMNADVFSVLIVAMTAFFFFQAPVNPLNDSLTMLTIRGSGKSYASFRIWGSIGFAAAALLFGFLFEKSGVGLAMNTAVITIALSLLLALGLQDRRTGLKRMQFAGIWRIAFGRRMLWFIFVILLLSISHRINDHFLALFLRHLGAPDSIVGWSWLASAISEIPVFFLISRYGHRFKELPLLAAAGLAYSVRFALMGLTDNPLWIIPIQCLHSISFGIFLFTAIRYLQELVPDEYRSTGQALFAVVWSGLAGLISGAGGGWIFQHWGPHVLYFTASGMALAGSLFILAGIAFERSRDSAKPVGGADRG